MRGLSQASERFWSRFRYIVNCNNKISKAPNFLSRIYFTQWILLIFWKEQHFQYTLFTYCFFFSQVLFSLEYEPNISDLTMALISAMGHLLESSDNFPCEQPKALQKNRYVDFLTERLGETEQKNLLSCIIEDSLKYGHFYALSIPYLR